MSAVECEEVPADKLEEVDFDALPFNDNRYWAHFYDDEDEDQRDFYDWHVAGAVTTSQAPRLTSVAVAGMPRRAGCQLLLRH